MGLSRLDNFLKSSKGTILYVNPNDLDSTDSIENQGNSMTRPFRTIQRALIEAARFSYQRGLNNDRFGKTTILIYPGEHIVDNRPGFIPDGANNFRLRNGTTSNDLSDFDLTSNFDVTSSTNELYKLNSVHGGIIVPRGTSIVGLDLRKTKIRPKYVPDPLNDSIARSAVFRITGAGYFWQFSIFDADPNAPVFKDYTQNTFVPNFSHHKLTCFEYADGVNPVVIDDDFQTFTSTRTDLDMYYEKVSMVYGEQSGRTISPEYPDVNIDIEKKIDEYRIVGSIGESVGITSIRAGDGVISSSTITVTTSEALDNLEVDTPFRIENITAAGYDGQYVVFRKPSDTEITFKANTIPANPLPNVSGATLTLSSDTVTSASPYIFNVSLRSVFGMNGMHADGSKATGFRSMVVAQFTGIGLQKDDNAFVIFNNDTPSTGNYDDSTSAGNSTISNNSRARYKPEWRNVHIKCSNKSIIQVVSCFAIGFAEQFVAESGGDISLTNSNSNFGAVALSSDGYRTEAFTQDDQGYITHILPPKELPIEENPIEFSSIDVLKTLPATYSSVGVGTTSHLFLYNETNSDVLPENIIEGYRVGARDNDQLNFVASIDGTLKTYSSTITMPIPVGTAGTSSGVKTFNVGRTGTGVNKIGVSGGTAANIITLESDHNLFNGESIRIISSTGQLPDGLSPDTVYFAITNGVGISTIKQLKLAQSLSDAVDDIAININSKGGELKISSRVSDKVPGELGHPIQFDDFNNQWYINVSGSPTDNKIFPAIVGLGSTALGNATPRTFIERKRDERSGFDKLYHVRYVIPKNSAAVSRPPVEGFILQDTNGSAVTQGEVNTFFGSGDLSNSNDHRNMRFIHSAEWNATSRRAIFSTELPHNLEVGNKVKITKIKSGNNLNGLADLGFNGSFDVVAVSHSKSFAVSLSSNPGAFQNNTNLRDTTLPQFSRVDFENGVYYTYRVAERQKYLRAEQDGIYYLTLLDSSIKPSVAPFTSEKFSQPVKQLFPQLRRDDPISDPQSAQSHVRSSLIGQVDVSDKRHSITRKAFEEYSLDASIGLSVDNIVSNQTGTAHTITTNIDHGLQGIIKLSVVDGGANYGSGVAGDEIFYNAQLTNSDTSKTVGNHATAKVIVGSGGTIKEVRIMDGGSAYGIGNTITVSGITTIANHVKAVLEVQSIAQCAGEVVKVSGIGSESLNKYNDLYVVSGIDTGQTKQIKVSSAATITDPISVSAGILGLGAELLTSAQLQYTGCVAPITSYTYDSITGIATVVSAGPHGFAVDQKIRLDGADQSLYNGNFVITKINDNLTIPTYGFEVNVGITTTQPTQTGSMNAYPMGYSSNKGTITSDDENFGGRQVSNYAGITTTISAPVSDLTSAVIRIAGASQYNINIGDYFQIDDEIVKVRRTTATSSLSGASNTNALQDNDDIVVFRGVLGTKAATHPLNSTIKRINILPVEFRRHSIIRASGHTFEYVGYGPGNYSTAFPDKQDREITAEEELISQSTKRAGGINFYTGMNDKGISYSGNRKLSTITGREEIFDTPVETVEGEDILALRSINVLTGVEANLSRSIKVDGGLNKEAISEFNGPVIVSNKLTVRSDKGVESNNLFLQGDASVSRKYTVGLGTPSLSGNPGDLVFNANPVDGGNAGWIYTLSNNWRSFGTVSLTTNTKEDLFERVGIGTTTAGNDRLRILGGDDQMSVDNSGHVGIGTSANGFALNVIGGNVYIDDDFVIGAGLTVTGQFSVNNGPVTIGGTTTQITGVGIHTIYSGTYAGMGVSVFPVDPHLQVYYYGDGGGLVNLNADQTGWIRQGDNLSYEDVLNGRVGIGTSIPDGGTATDFLLGYSLTVGSAIVGQSGTSLHVHDGARITGSLAVETDLEVIGFSTLSGPYRIDDTTRGEIVGTAATFVRSNITGFSTCNDVFISGITTSDSHTYLRTFSETNNGVTQSGNILTLDLSTGQNFEVTLSGNVDQIRLTNPPTDSSAMSFTVKFTQPSGTFYTVDIDDIRITPFATTNRVNTKWPGGVVPVMSQAVNAVDIYSFKSFDISNLNTSGLYGIIGGQNFV